MPKTLQKKYASILTGVLLLYTTPVLQAQEAGWLNSIIDHLDPESDIFIRLNQFPTGTSDAAFIDTLATYFRQKPSLQPRWIIPNPAPDSPYDPTLADEAVLHRITTREGTEQFGDTLPWFDPDKRLTTISRFPFFDQLAPAYYLTGDEKYARVMVLDMLDFVEHVPIDKAEAFTVQDPHISNPFNWVMLQWRVTRWIDALDYLKDSPSLSNTDYLRILHHLWTEVEWLVPRMMLGMHNGTLGNTRTIIYAGLHYPETRQGAYWLEFGVNFLHHFLQTAFYPNEFLIELSLGYSEGTLLMCTMIYEGLPEHLRARIREPLERVIQAHIGMMKPDRSLPRYGDHGIYNIRDRVLRTGARLFDRPDWFQLADDTNPPVDVTSMLSFPAESRPYYLSGYYAMREHWGVDAQYLAMDAGPFGTNHQHADKLSIVVSADGADFIVDPGTSLYRSVEPGPRYDLRFGFLHNVITIDGIDPNTGWDRHYGFDVLDNRWVTNPTYDFLEGIYEYRNNLLDVIWRRSIFYKRGEYWLLLDALLGEGVYHMESNFQFAPDNEIEIEGNAVQAVSSDQARLDMVSLEDDLTPMVIKGDSVFPGTTYLIQYPQHVDWTFGGRGWVGYFGNESTQNPTRDVPAPAVVFQGEVELPHYSIRVLSPSNNKQPQPVHVSWLERTTRRFALKIEHQTQDVTDYLVWFPAQRPQEHKPLPDDRGYWVRFQNKEPTEIIFMNTDTVDFDMEDIRIQMSFSEAAEGSAKKTDQGWTIFLDRYNKTALELKSFNVRSGMNSTTMATPVMLQPGDIKSIL